MTENFEAGDHTPQQPVQPSAAEKLAAARAMVGGVHFSAPFIQRPVATMLLSAAVLLAGAVAYTLLPVASLPQVEFPTISVNASLPGGDPETMASAVATPLERQFSKIAGITQMTSVSSVGSVAITMQFDLDREVNGAARDVQAAINAARSQLPSNLPSNPTFRKQNPADGPIVMLGMTSDTLAVPQLYDVSDSILAQKLAQVQGVGQVYTTGSAKPAVRIEADPNLLTSYGIGLQAVATALGQVNIHQPTGYLTNNNERISISTTDQLFGAAAYAPLIVATNRGPVSSATATTGLPASVQSAVTSAAATSSTATRAPAAANADATAAIATPASGDVRGTVRLRDIGQVIDSVEDIHSFGSVNGDPCIVIIVTKAPGANVIATADKVLSLLPMLRASISPSIKLRVVLDRTLTIRASVKEVTRTLVISIVLVILVVFLFLREVRSTLIPSVSVPLSILGTFGVMYLLGYSLDNLSLMALTISTGFVVDDAIVVIENISRHLELGLSPYQAAMVGSKEIGFTVVSMSTSLIAVFIPILLMGGIVGRLFREFAVTLSASIVVSLIVSLTTTPMLSAKFLEAHWTRTHGRLYRWGEQALDWFTGEYDKGLRWVLRHQGIVLLITVGTVALNVYLFTIVPKGFFPQQDTGRIGGQVRGQQDVSFNSLKAKLLMASAIVQKDRGVENVMTYFGAGGFGGGGGNVGNIFMSLKPDEEREKTGDTPEVIIGRLRGPLSTIPGAQVLLQSQQDLQIGGRQTATQYQYSLTGDTSDELATWAPQLMAKMMTMPEVKDVATDQMQNGLQAKLVIDRDTASRLGVSVLAIDSTLSDAFGQAQVSTTYMPLNQYHVVLEEAQPFQQDVGALGKLFVKSTTGAMIPLSAVTHYESKRIPLQINHQGLSPAATLSFNLTPGYSLSQATVAIEAARNQLAMPSTIHGGFQGTAQAFQASLSSEPILILLALVAVYIVLGVLYESFIHPLTILSTLPSAGVGAIVALLLMKVDLSVIAMIGIILLIGIVKKNAIMMIDFALVAEREEGKTPKEAIYQACLLRFRPIMMTTMAALLGGLPLALGTGTGSELRRPLGITIVGGLIVSQALTLFTTPVVYLFFDRLRNWIESLRGKGKPQRVELGHAVPVAGD